MIYLASPYSSPLPAVQRLRFIEAERFVAYHFRLGVPLLSPIVYCHSLAEKHSLPGDAAFWRFLNNDLFLICDQMWVLKLPGWDLSVGVAEEIKTAELLSIPLYYKEPLPNG